MDANKDIHLKKIPAFTVLKNGSILKNIFLLRKPPPFSTQEESTIDSSSIHQESDEEILLVGRHPQCNITLEHPSISRYHLRIHSNPSSQKLSVIDLSSVHGTWVSGKRIESRVHVKLKEGDTVKMGSSSRVYELHWVPLSRAYDVDDPFIPAVYAFKIKQDGDCLCPSEDDLEGLNLGKLDPLTSPNCSDSCSDDTEVEHSSPSNGNGEISSSSLVQPSPVVLETRSVIEDSDSRNGLENQSNWLGDKTSDEFEQLSNGTIKEDEFSVPNCSSSSRDDMEVEDSSPWKTGNESGELFATVSVQVPLAVSETISATEISDNNLNKSEDQSSVKDDRVSMAFLDSIMQGEDALDQEIASDNEIDEVSECEIVNQQKVENSPVSMALFSGVSRDENGFLMPLRADGEQVNMGCDFEQMNQTNMMDALVQGEDALDQDIENDNEIDEVSEYETVNQQKTENGPVPMALFSGVNRDEDGFFMPLRAEGEQVNMGCDFEQMNQANMMDAIVQGKDALDQDIENDNEIDEVSVYETVNQQKVDNSPVPMTLFSGVNRDENGSFIPLGAEGEQVTVGCDFEQMNLTNKMDESASVVLFDGVGSKVNDDVICSSIISRGEEVDMDVELELFDQETPKKDSVLVALPEGIHMDQEQTFTPDILRTKEVDMNLEALHNISVSMNLFDSLDGNELEIFTSGKENKNPNSCSVKSLKRRWKEDENEQSNHCSISRKAFNPVDNEEKNISNFSNKLFTEDMISFSSLEKETESRIVKMEGTYNPINYPQTVQKVIDSSHNIMGVAKKRWTMVVDTNSLLHNESLKHLKLLQGIIGTQLFVPKIVIRELTDIKGQDDILEKRTKKVSLALKWIDECMVDTKWWIHMDDEILNSSEAEPQILETALRLCKEVTDRKIIILSNDLTLKIKAMAEGVICESAEEFHRSLVNPFSERFMWVGSSARGLTWSCVDDDDVLRQKYNGSTLNVSHRLKGLKLLANI